MTAPIARVTRSVISGPDTQAAIWFLGALPQPRVSGGADRRGLRPGRPPRPARQRQPGPRPQPDNETFFVLDGELRVFAGEEEHTAGPAPSRCCPGVSVTPMSSPPPPRGSSPLHTPAGFEQFATEVGEPARALTLPPPAGPPDFAALAQASARDQITILTPPPQP